MNTIDLSKKIADKIKKKYNGVVDCEKQRADLFIYKDGIETSILKITDTHIVFEDSKVELVKSDIHWLSYIDNCI